MPDYPIDGGSDGEWGGMLENWDQHEHYPDGTHRSKVIPVTRFGEPGGDNTTHVQQAIEAATFGDVIYFPPGVWIFSPISCTKALTFAGADRFASWLQPLAATTSPLISFDLPATSPTGSNRGYYGPAVRDLGLNLYPAAGATGVRMGVNAGWARMKNLYFQGGACSIENRGTNNWIEDVVAFDATKFFIIDGDTGMELTMRDIAMGRNSAGTTAMGIEVICDSGGIKGALFMQNVRLSSGTEYGVTQTTGGMKVSAPTKTGVPVFADGVILDNIIGGGPGIELINIEDFMFQNGWVNTGATTGGPAVRINGGGRISFLNNRFFGGAEGGGTAKTYDFVGGSTTGFISKGNFCPTGPVYFLPSSAKPTDMQLDDVVPGATAIEQVTNDAAGLAAATALGWGPRNHKGSFLIEPELVHLIGGAGEPAFQNSWANSGSVTYFWKDATYTVHVAGVISGGTSGLIFTLPAGYRPPFTEHFAVVDNTGASRVCEVLTNGQVLMYGSFPPAAPISLSFTFRMGS